jgi:hypothetical protein
MRIQNFEAMQRDITTHDPIPDPEPAAPSLPAPDLGVFDHEPGQPHHKPSPLEKETDPA